MRLWSIHPKYLDHRGLVALWREGLLAQKVLRGETKGYKNHPQLERFKDCGSPVAAIASYLSAVCDEADSRDYNFDRSKLPRWRTACKIPVNSGQVEYEFKHLLAKLKVRDSVRYSEIKDTKRIDVHPMFRLRKGAVESWEKV